MLFFINSALEACRASILEQGPETHPLSRRATLERARASILEQGP